MEYGMPPQSGWGMGIERILALLTCQDNLRDVVLFPLMKSDKNEEKKKTTNLAVVILNQESKLEDWQKLNTTAHLAASFAARKGNMLFDIPVSESRDGEKIMMNISDAILIKTASSRKEIDILSKNILNFGYCEIYPFTREMLESSDDKLVDQRHKAKDMQDIEVL